MGKLIKALFAIVLGLIGLIVVAVVVLPMVIDPNDYKAEILAAVKKSTGRDLQIDQPLELAVFPALGIKTGDVTLSNATGFGKEPFAVIKSLAFKIQLLPLLSGKVIGDTLVLDGLDLNLQRNAAGRTNWSDLGGDKAADKGDKPKAEADKASGEALDLRIAGVQIHAARVRWDDRQAGANYVLDGVDLTTGELAAGQVVPIELVLRLAAQQPRMDVALELSAAVEANAAFDHVTVNDLRMHADVRGEGLPSAGMKLDLLARIVADLAKDSVQISDLSLKSDQVQLVGGVAVTRMTGADRGIKGNISVKETNLRELMHLLGVDVVTTDPKALTQVSAELTLGGERGELKLEPFTLRLDDSALQGYLHVLDTKGPKIRTSMTLDAIDLDRYLPPAVDVPAGAAGKGGTTTPSQDPFAPLRTLDLVAEFKIGTFKVKNAHMRDIRIKAVSKNGVLTLDPFDASLYQGKLNSRVKLDARKPKPAIAVVQHLAGVEIGELLGDVAGNDKLRGVGDLNLDLSFNGLAADEIRRSLNGSGDMALKNGAFKGINLAKVIRSAGGLLGTNTATTGNTGDENETDFSELGGSFQAKDGLIRNNDLLAKSPLLRVSGTGLVDLPKNTVDYVVTAKVVGSLEGQGGKGGQDLTGLSIPVHVEGPLDNPKYKPDFSALVTDTAKQKLQEKAETEIKKKLKGVPIDLLKGVFGR